MAYTSKIEDTKQLGYVFVDSQGSIKLGTDIGYPEAAADPDFDSSTYTPTYVSVNSEGISVKNEGEEGEDLHPIDETGSVGDGGTDKYTVETDSFTFNKNNPVHKFLNKIAMRKQLGLNIPIIVEDYAAGEVMEGLANITVETEGVGGEKRKLTPVFTFIGAPKITEITE